MAKSKYDDNFPLLAEDYARRGLTDIQIAEKLGISKATFYEYQKTYPDFLDSIKRGKKPVDVEVENALLKRAQGYEYEEVHVEFKTGQEEEKAKPKSIKKIKKQVVPDVTAQIFWLKNRRSKLWRDRHDIEHSGSMNFEISEKFLPKDRKKSDEKK